MGLVKEAEGNTHSIIKHLDRSKDIYDELRRYGKELYRDDVWISGAYVSFITIQRELTVYDVIMCNGEVLSINIVIGGRV